ncbi:hypothetical protein [Nonomuraea bangladeshensis]|uniref:hypothetical protein n=1 Tax=Nonomuraea bangladeshensis TaxID=404385 RepID=UPI0031D15891
MCWSNAAALEASAISSTRSATPFLGLVFGGAQVLVTTSANDHVTLDDVEFARSLAREAAMFAGAVERMFHGLPNGPAVAGR